MPNGRTSRNHSQAPSSTPSTQPATNNTTSASSLRSASAMTSPTLASRPGPLSRQTSSSLHASLPLKPIGAPTNPPPSPLSPHAGARQRLSPSLPAQSMSQQAGQGPAAPRLTSPAASTSSPVATPSLSTTSTTLETTAPSSSNTSAIAGQAPEAVDARMRISSESGSHHQPHQQYHQQQQQSGYNGMLGQSSYGQPARGGKRGGALNNSRGGRGGYYGDRTRGGYGGGANLRNNSPSLYMGGLSGQQQQPGPYYPYGNGYFDPSSGVVGQGQPFFGNTPAGGPGFYPPPIYGPMAAGPYFIPPPVPTDQQLGPNIAGNNSNSSQPGSPPQQPQMLPFPPPGAPVQFAEMGLHPYNPYLQGFDSPQPFISRPSPLFNYESVAFPPDGTAYWVLGQIEFYLSPDNLVKDVFLRQSVRYRSYNAPE